MKIKTIKTSLLGSLATASIVAATLFTGTLAQADSNTVTNPVAAYDSQIKNDGTNVYYPANVTVDTPVALLLQGGKVHRQHYSAYAKEIASYGFIVVTPNHKRLNFFDNNYYTSTSQIKETLDWMKAEDARAGSALKGKIDENKLVLLGHSFGGATGLSISESKCSVPFCTGITFKLPSEVKAGSFYGTHNTFLGMNPKIANKIPVQLVQGLDDGVASPSEAEATYSKLEGGPKQIVRVTGANHYGITNTQDPSGANAEVQGQALTQEDSIEVTARWAAQFLKAQLGDTAANAYISGAGDAADVRVTTTSANLS